MAGGTSRKNHSEIGSSFIHFNYTPNQDKATPSMMGDIHNGVMLASKPIFLGGQGGLVGPVKINFGCITAAGSIIRKSELKKDRLLLGGAFKEISFPRQYDVYKNISHVFNNNIYYIAGLISLKSWYKHIRSLFVYDNLSKALLQGMRETLDDCINERIHRFKIFCEKLKVSKEILLTKNNIKGQSKTILMHDKAIKQFQYAETVFKVKYEKNQLNSDGRQFIEIIKQKITNEQTSYISAIQNLDLEEHKKGSDWLFNIEHSMVEKLLI